MTMAFERIPLGADHTYRLLHWTDHVGDVKWCKPNGNRQSIKGAGETWHFHPELELTLVTEGGGRRFVGDHLTTFEAPDLVLIGSNLPHYWSGVRPSSGYSIQFALDASHPIWQLGEMQGLTRIGERAERGLSFSTDVASQAHRLMTTMVADEPAEQLAHFIELLSIVDRVDSTGTQHLSSRGFSLADQEVHLEAISHAVQHLMTHMFDDIRLDTLLELTRMSKSTFSRQFKRHTGRTFMRFLNEVRVDHAKRLLNQTPAPITTIALDSGFPNLSHFNRQFLAIVGSTPRAYRRACADTT